MSTDVPFVTRLCALSACSKLLWPSLILDDVLRLSRRMPHRFADLSNPAEAMKQWLDCVVSHGNRWSKVLTILTSSKDPPLVPHAATTDPYRSQTLHFRTHCDLSSGNVSAVMTHKFRRHGYRNLARSYVAQRNTCAACLHSFSSRDKVIKHLAYDSKPCLALLQSIYSPLPESTVIDHDSKAVSARRDSDRSRSCVRHAVREHGPLIHADLVTINGRISFS